MNASDVLDLFRKTNLNLVPAVDKRPVGQWKKFQNIKITELELKSLLKSEFNGVGIVLGGEDKIECID
ncbi:MAG: hypothetical protein N2560_01585, partial [Ignavibacteria bacterium]|nr:hypothetical protein [Ignavibacteria bacterium]